MPIIVQDIISYYERIKNDIKLVSGFMEKDYDFLIRSCRLKPSKLKRKKSNKSEYHIKWHDEYGNSIIFNKEKNKIITGDLSIRDKIFVSDLFKGISITNAYKISKKIFIYQGLDDEEFWILSFLGIDNFFRTYYLDQHEVYTVSTLFIGINNIIKMQENLNLTYFKSIDDSILLPSEKNTSYISDIPAHEDFLKVMNKLKPNLFDVIVGSPAI